MTTKELLEAKANKWLDKLVQTDFGVMRRRDFYTNYGIGKSKSVQKYAKKNTSPT